MFHSRIFKFKCHTSAHAAPATNFYKPVEQTEVSIINYEVILFKLTILFEFPSFLVTVTPIMVH